MPDVEIDGRPVTVADGETLLDEVGQCMRDASICGLGQTAYDAIDSALRRFQPFGAPNA